MRAEYFSTSDARCKLAGLHALLQFGNGDFIELKRFHLGSDWLRRCDLTGRAQSGIGGSRGSCRDCTLQKLATRGVVRAHGCPLGPERIRLFKHEMADWVHELDAKIMNHKGHEGARRKSLNPFFVSFVVERLGVVTPYFRW